MFTKRRLLVSLFSLCVFLAALSPVRAAGPENGAEALTLNAYPDLDVTNTAQGRDLAVKAVERWASLEYVTTSDQVRVFQLAPNEHLVVPVEALQDVRLTVEKKDDGTTVFRPKVSSSKRRPTPSEARGTVEIQTGGWTQVAGLCFARTEGNGGYMDTCYKLNKYSDPIWNGTAYRDAYAMHLYASTSGYYPYKITQSQIQADKAASSSTMEWADWNPKSDTTGNCRTYTIGFSINGFVANHSGTVCESWSVNKSSTPGSMASAWRHGSGGTAATREVALGEEVYVPVGGWPVWDFAWTFWWV